MLFKKEQEKITNSTQIKEILDKSKDISIKDEMIIMSYIYDLEERENAAFSRASQYSRQYLQAFNKLKDLKYYIHNELILEYSNDKTPLDVLITKMEKIIDKGSKDDE